MQKFQGRTRSFKSSALRGCEKHAGAVLRFMRLVLETDNAFSGSTHDIRQMVIVAGLKIEVAASRYCSAIDGQIARTAQVWAAYRLDRPGFHRHRLAGVRIDYRKIADSRHVLRSFGT